MANELKFLPQVNYAAGNFPWYITSGDFNADGKIDLTVANADSNNVSILLGNGNGTFQSKINYAVGDYPAGITPGDFNADGKIDLAVTNFDSDTVSILLGNGNGTFQSKVNYAVGDSPAGITPGDFNADGKTDLAVTNFNSDTVSILLGSGNGTFQSKVNYAVGDFPAGITPGDFNADGKTDLAVTNFNSDTVSILLGNGNGTFQSKVNYTTGDSPNKIAIGDFNRDGKSDLAITTSGVDKVDVLFGRGDGTFQARTSYTVQDWPAGIVVGDFNGDTYPDLAIANEGSDSVSLLLNNADGTFAAQIKYSVGSGSFGLTTADFNGDGKLDLATANDIGDNVSVLLNNSPYTPNPGNSGINKTFSATPNLAIPDPGKITAKITVSGMSGTITDINVGVNINHIWDDDLDVYLIAPNGQRIELFTDVGGDGDNFVNTVLDNEATTAITSGKAPFTGSFKPEGNLAALYGMNPNGVWTLEVKDDYRGDSGTLKSWGLTITGSGAPASVAAINGVPGAQTLNEDTTLVFASANGNLVSVADSDSANLTVTLSATNGVLTLANSSGLSFTSGDGTSDSSMKFSGAITELNNALNGLKFTPNANYSGSAQLKIETSDGTKSDSDTVALTIFSVNDAPVGSVTISGTPAIGQTLTATNNLTDADGLGTISYQWLRNGTTISGATSNRYTVSTSDAGNAIKVSANYTDGGGHGEQVFSAAVTVAPLINQAPSGADKTLTLNEDASYTITATDFGFSDPDGNNFLAVKITNIPISGALTLNNVTATNGQIINVTDINAGRLKFTPTANSSGANYASFSFQVQDNGGIANGGIDLDATANRMTWNVTAVNDAPSGRDKTINLNENSSYAMKTADFGFSDPDGNNFLAVKITNIPTSGALTLNNVTATNDQIINVTDINAGRLKFTPTANSSGANYASFSFQVQDNGGIANGGIDLDATPNQISYNVTRYMPPGVIITPQGDATTSELGGEAQFNVALNTRPTAEVSVIFTSNNPAEGVPVNAKLVFTADNWNTPQVLVIRGVDDTPDDRYSGSDPADGDVVYNISGKVISDDIDYIRDVDPAPLQLVNMDDPADTPQDLYGDTIPGNYRDRLTGGNGGDRIYGLLNIDELRGERGNDLLNGGQDLDFLYGELGNDTLEGESGNDKLYGAEGDDNLSGGEGDDTLDGGSGADQLNGDNGKDSLLGGDGIDVLNGGNQDDNLQGGAGDDQLFGQEGNDQLFGGEGMDILNGGTGANTMDGGNGADSYYLDTALTDVINDTGSDGAADTVIVPLVSRYTLAPTIENGQLSGSLNANLTGNNLNNNLQGNIGNNTLDGGQGNDVLSGGAGADSLIGGGGVDTADYSGASGAVNANLTTGKAITSDGNDILTTIENILGGDANDTLNGNSGANVLTGGVGNDKLIGENGADTIIGGAGQDTLTGNDGADYFVFSAVTDMEIGTTRDVITDFSAAQADKIDLRQLDANPDIAGIQAWSFIAGAFDGNTGSVRFDSGNHVVQFDLNGDLQVDFEIELTGVTTLTAADFILI